MVQSKKSTKSCKSSKRRMKSVGSKDEVWEGLAKHTSGKLTKKDLVLNSSGKVVSRRKSEMAKKNNYIENIREFQYQSSGRKKKCTSGRKKKSVSRKKCSSGRKRSVGSFF